MSAMDRLKQGAGTEEDEIEVYGRPLVRGGGKPVAVRYGVSYPRCYQCGKRESAVNWTGSCETCRAAVHR